MRFRKWPRVTAYEDTPRKRAALVRSQRLEREKLPLLTELIGEQQSSAGEEMARRASLYQRSQQSDRDWRARKWREARSRLHGYEPKLRRILVALWRESPYPADPIYLLEFLSSIEKGRIDPRRPPWKYYGPDALRARPIPRRSIGATLRLKAPPAACQRQNPRTRAQSHAP
jgi:hypothetical protein